MSQLYPTSDQLIIDKYAEVFKQHVEDLVYKHMNETIRNHLNTLIETAKDEATKGIAKKLLELAIRDLK